MATETESMASDQGVSTGIATNVTRTRVTVLVFNLTIISLMLPLVVGGARSAGQPLTAHLPSSVALFFGFCLTLLGLFWLLHSQNWDPQGLSRPWPFTLGAMTTYLALSQTVTAFMHEYLLRIESAVVDASRPIASESSESVLGLDALGDGPILILLVSGAAIWTLITYAAPLTVCLKSPVRGGRTWFIVGYYVALQVPIYWIYARAWHRAYVPADQPANMLSIFALQFVQPLLWFR